MPSITFTPASNSPLPPHTLEVDPRECATAGELRELVGRRYYVEGRQVMLIFKGRVLASEVELAKLGLREREKMNISISCPPEQEQHRQTAIEIEEPIEERPTPKPTPNKAIVSSAPARKTSKPTRSSFEEQEEDEHISKLFLAMQGKSKSNLGILATVMKSMISKTYDYDLLREEFAVELAQLKEMGVATPANEEQYLKELYLCNGDIYSAMEYISKADK